MVKAKDAILDEANIGVTVTTELTQDHVVDAAVVEFEKLTMAEQKAAAAQLSTLKKQSEKIDEDIEERIHKFLNTQDNHKVKLMLRALEANSFERVEHKMQFSTTKNNIHYNISYLSKSVTGVKNSVLSTASITCVMPKNIIKLREAECKIDEEITAIEAKLTEIKYSLSTQNLSFVRRKIVGNMVANILPKSGARGKQLFQAVFSTADIKQIVNGK